MMASSRRRGTTAGVLNKAPRRLRVVAGAGLLVLLSACGAVTVSDAGGTATPPQSAPHAGTSMRPDPDAGLTPAQRNATYQAMQAAFERKYVALLT